MAGWFTRRRSIGVLIAILIVGGLAGGVGLRASKRAAAEAADKAATVTLEFAAADLAFVEPAALTRWLPLSGTLQPVDQTTVKSKVSGEIRQVTVREGQAVKAGQVIVRFDTADLEAKLTDRIGALEASRAQLALAEKMRVQNQLLLKQNFISQTAYDSAESNLSVTQGTVKSIEAQAQLAKNALRDAVVAAPLSGTVAKRHVQPGGVLLDPRPLAAPTGALEPVVDPLQGERVGDRRGLLAAGGRAVRRCHRRPPSPRLRCSILCKHSPLRCVWSPRARPRMRHAAALLGTRSLFHRSALAL